MSHGFKRLKPLSKNKRNTKSRDAESPKRLPMERDSVEAAVYDFLYVDRGRVSALYAQLFPQGTLTSVKTTAQSSYSDDQSIGSDLKVIKGDTKSTDSGAEGIEHIFDASWAIPVEVLARLTQRSLVRSSLRGANLGTIALLDGFIRIIDYTAVKDMWEPVMTMLVGEDKPGFKGVVGIMKNIPHTMHAHFLTECGYLWASLEPQNLMVPPADIVLKHGGSVSGTWKVLFLLDAYPEFGQVAPTAQSWSAGDATEGVLNALHILRSQIGRPFHWFGITPLLIYRQVSQNSQEDGQSSVTET
jgi:hypothetical protein